MQALIERGTVALILAGEMGFFQKCLLQQDWVPAPAGKKHMDSDQGTSPPFTFAVTGCNPISFVGSNQPKGFCAITKVF